MYLLPEFLLVYVLNDARTRKAFSARPFGARGCGLCTVWTFQDAPHKTLSRARTFDTIVVSNVFRIASVLEKRPSCSILKPISRLRFVPAATSTVYRLFASGSIKVSLHISVFSVIASFFFLRSRLAWILFGPTAHQTRPFKSTQCAPIYPARFLQKKTSCVVSSSKARFAYPLSR